jgi:hypothetical protein
MADLKQIIRDELVAFAWDDYGLDDVVDADPEWADNLAGLIADTVSHRVLWPVEITEDIVTRVHAERELHATTRALVHVALEAAGFRVDMDGGDAR